VSATTEGKKILNFKDKETRLISSEEEIKALDIFEDYLAVVFNKKLDIFSITNGECVKKSICSNIVGKRPPLHFRKNNNMPSLLVVATYNGVIDAFNYISGSHLKSFVLTFEMEGATETDHIFIHGNHLLAHSRSGKIKVWNIDTGVCIQSVFGIGSPIMNDTFLIYQSGNTYVVQDFSKLPTEEEISNEL